MRQASLKNEKVLVSHSHFLSLVYHDLFSYPLKEEELVFWGIGEEGRPAHFVEKTGDFWHLPEKKNIVLSRIAKQDANKTKLNITRKAVKILSFIPGIKLVGVSGALSMENAKKEDDIDLFVLTAVDTLWVTRLLSLLFLKVFGIPVRRFGEKDIKNKLCLNLWVDERSMSLLQRRDIYTAHEILQIKVLYDEGGAYKKFLMANSWVREFFPKGFENRIKCAGTAQQCQSMAGGYSAQDRKKPGVIAVSLNSVIAFALRLFNSPAYALQNFYMSSKRTKEVVGVGNAFFHPFPWRENINKMFLIRLERIAKGKTDAKPLYQQASS